ncbi:hypothetical protein SDC9_114654 [bioreactor metagenome]|uniref:Uncharacterized protein n=1 Tax=bioreactor metagenome TaxID=1076179 RepID=A0A645BQM7_9ZZZZ
MGSAFAADNFADLLVKGLLHIGLRIDPGVLRSISVILITIILSYFTLVFGELVPKRIAMKNAEKLALGMSGLINFISKLFAPIVWLLTVSTNGVLRLFKIDPNEHDEKVTEEEIRMMIDEGSEKGTIDATEKTMIQNVFEFDDIPVEDIMTHRKDVCIIWLEDEVEKWYETIDQNKHTQYPICDGSVDNVIGTIDTKSYFRLADKSKESILTQAIKQPIYVPESVKSDVLFATMKKTRNHFAIVMDEYGGMSGIVTINDLLEQIVGDIDDEDEVEENESEIKHLDENTWEVSGETELDDLSQEIGVEFFEEDVDTLSGFILSNYGMIPEDGSTFELDILIPSLHVKVLDVKDHKIEKSIIFKKVEEEPEKTEKSAKQEKE